MCVLLVSFVPMHTEISDVINIIIPMYCMSMAVRALIRPHI